ncbi:ubiquinol-cytochrome c reductase cytochrome c1 subunit [Sphingomonas sp. YR710]|uniref:cytochrome c1 n=1 Tax=Sphingomonas sp. YR710 TaxID=1882773 RepID=UPI0008856F07|nr:cytochrome c1 [Sphingomonas sp. YR710]SDC44630.1 ubiquinol-cytochrome c reductase cytochrome c1 subunit [Sphingomonas sp. YR710]
MVRPIAFLAGLGFVGVLLYSLLMGAIAYVSEPPAPTAESVYHQHPKEVSFASDGPLGKFDRQQLQRGFQVYKEVCSACHSLHQVAFRDFKDLGFTDPEVKAIAKGWATEVPSINPETGEPATRKGTPADKIPTPYANETAARAANNNALPPDLSLVSKSRHGGAAYIYSLLTGFQKQPAELIKQFPDAKTPPSLHYNPYFANLNIAMPPPLVADGQVTYSDGTKSTVDQMAKDVSAFLVWTAEPKLEARHQTGLAVVIFLLIATSLAFLSYRNIWAGVKH